MLRVLADTHARIPYKATLFPTSFILDSLLALTIHAQRRTQGLCFTWGTMMFRDEMRRGLTRQSVGPLVDTVNVTTVMSLNRVDSGSFGSLCCAFRRTDTSADPIRLFSIQLALPFYFATTRRIVYFICGKARCRSTTPSVR